MNPNQPHPTSTHYQLSEEEKEKSIELFKKYEGDLLLSIRELFKNDNEKGSTSRGRAVRQYWIDSGLSYRTKTKKRANDINSYARASLTPEEKDFIRRHYNPELTKKELAKIIWPEECKTKNFFEGDKFVLMSEFVTNEFSAYGLKDEITAKYSPPKMLGSLVKRINKIIMKEFDPEKLSMVDKKNLEKLLNYLNAPRFIQVINSYITKESRDLFEGEYIRSTWDKPDLTPDELNLYINVCMDYVNLREIELQKQKLNAMFDDAEAQNDLTMRLTEMLKTKAEEYNQCTNRIDKMLAKLNGERSKRIQNQHQKNASIISLVQLFQDEQERKLMIQMAEMQKKVVYEEADKFEKMSEWKARVLGISKLDAI